MKISKDIYDEFNEHTIELYNSLNEIVCDHLKNEKSVPAIMSAISALFIGSAISCGYPKKKSLDTLDNQWEASEGDILSFLSKHQSSRNAGKS